MNSTKKKKKWWSMDDDRYKRIDGLKDGRILKMLIFTRWRFWSYCEFLFQQLKGSCWFLEDRLLNTPERFSDMEFSIKPISFLGRDTVIICQNENGPCPLLAIANVLLLQRRITLSPDIPRISLQELIQTVANAILEASSRRSSNPDAVKELESVLNILPKLANGLDLNVFFSSVQKFEFTEEISVFDALSISLLHGND